MVAIKNMEMPESCNECPFKANDYVCGLLDCAFSCNHFKERNYNCPLVEIITCENCNNHGLDREHHPDIDGARYCPTLHTYTGFDYYCGDAERKGEEDEAD